MSICHSPLVTTLLFNGMGGSYSPTQPRRISPVTSILALKDMEMDWEYYKLDISHILLIISLQNHKFPLAPMGVLAPWYAQA